jgi:hypothetical protein
VEAARVCPFNGPVSKAKIAFIVLAPSLFGLMNWIKTAFSDLRQSTFTIFFESTGFFEEVPSDFPVGLLADDAPLTSFFTSGFSSLTPASSSSSSWNTFFAFYFDVR